MEVRAWKAVHVLAGSIAEAVLLEYLLVSDYQKRTEKDPLKFTITDAMKACLDEGVISQRASDLAAVIRAYRNLIHPGRAVRLQERVDTKTAAVAKALVDILIEEVAAAKTYKYGMTAVQIANKLINDSTASALLPMFLNETTEFERLRLLNEVIPERYFELLNEEFQEVRQLVDLEKAFRTTFETLTDDNKKIIARHLPKLLREAIKNRIFSYEDAFFKGSDLAYLTNDEAAMVKEHLLSRFSLNELQNLTPDSLGILDGIEDQLDARDVERLTDGLVRVALYHKTDALKKDARTRLNLFFIALPKDFEPSMKKRTDAWLGTFENRGSSELAALMKELIDEIYIPF